MTEKITETRLTRAETPGTLDNRQTNPVGGRLSRFMAFTLIHSKSDKLSLLRYFVFFNR